MMSLSHAAPPPTQAYELVLRDYGKLALKLDVSGMRNVSRDLPLQRLKQLTFPPDMPADYAARAQGQDRYERMDVPPGAVADRLAEVMFPKLKDKKAQERYGAPSDYTVEFVFHARIDGFTYLKAPLRRKGTNGITLLTATDACNPNIKKGLSSHNPNWVVYKTRLDATPDFWHALKALPLV